MPERQPLAQKNSAQQDRHGRYQEGDQQQVGGAGDRKNLKIKHEASAVDNNARPNSAAQTVSDGIAGSILGRSTISMIGKINNALAGT